MTDREKPEAMTMRLWLESLAPDELLSPDLRVSEAVAARLIGTHVDTLARWRDEGDGPDFYRLRGRIQYSLPLLANFVESCRQASGGKHLC